MASCCKCSKNLTIQSNYTLDLPVMGKTFTDLVKKVNDFVPCIKLLPKGPNGYVPVVQTEKAIQEGKLDCAFTGLSYSFVQKSFYELYTSIPFGMTAFAYITYLFTEGLDKLNAQAEKDGLFFYPMALLPPETGGWFNKEFTNSDDFKDLKMRIYGLGRNIIDGIGGNTVFLGQTDIIPALKSGLINSVEYSIIEIDEGLGLPDVCKYWYTPSWNQLSTVLYFVCNLKKWKSLTDKQRNMIQIFMKENMYTNYFSSNAKQVNYLIKYQSQLKTFPNNVLDSLKQSWFNWLNLPQNKNIKEEYEKMKAYEYKYNSYENIMKNNVFN